jgi:uncharacterized protein (TIRG00374 family)
MPKLEKPQPFKKWISIVAIIGFIAFIVYLFFFTNFTEVEVVIGGTDVPIYVLAFIAVIASVLFDALSWRSILKSLGPQVSFWRVFELTWIGQFIDSLIPGGWVGDLFKTYLLAKEDNIHAAKATAAIIIKDVIELLFILGSLIVGITLLLSFYTISGVVMTAIIVTLLFLTLPLILILILAVNTRATDAITNGVHKIVCRVKGQQTGDAVREKLKGQIQEFHDGIISIKEKPKGMIEPAFYQTIAGLCNVLVLLFVFLALGTNIGFDKVLITNTIVSNIQGQGVVLAGVSQMVSTTLYNVLGITPVLSVASSLLAGFAGFWFRLVVSFGYFQLIAAEKCVPFFCRKCGGWRSWGKKSCDDPVLKA